VALIEVLTRTSLTISMRRLAEAVCRAARVAPIIDVDLSRRLRVGRVGVWLNPFSATLMSDTLPVTVVASFARRR
jgi:hypothetical protein